ncbi:Hypothetical protein, Slr0957 homolog [uncultured Synechococcales cyanobacterium]|uniref:DUF1816 domain-containing protein n=1 Tax=uncultured Synechococcales cyanobacterium TaxID=1936017 RepID=A0A6J4VXV4_9CYAN|nr:Hypothetical protein, Slr0957 homolog [uncultured Synechococcales cyanobacterium]
METTQNVFSGLVNEFSKLLNKLGLAWWVEVKTNNPRCTYYFGPFTSANEANTAKTGYIEDLEQEGAQGIAVAVRRCKPETLTVEEASPSLPGSLSGQLH